MQPRADLLFQLSQLPVEILQREILPHIEEVIKRTLSKSRWYDNLIASVTFQDVDRLAFDFSDMGMAFSFIVYESGYNERTGDHFEATEYRHEYSHVQGTFLMRYNLFIRKDQKGTIKKVCTKGNNTDIFHLADLENRHRNYYFDIYTLCMCLREKEYVLHGYSDPLDVCHIKNILQYEYERHLKQLLHIPDAYYVYSANTIIDRMASFWTHERRLSDFSRCELPPVDREMQKAKIEENQSIIKEWIDNMALP